MKKVVFIFFFLLIYRLLNSQTFININASLDVTILAGVDWGDYDNDGDLDLFISGYTTGAGESTVIYENKNGVFVKSSPTGLTNFGDCDLMWNDYDNDNELDYLLTGTYVSCATSPLMRNDLIPLNTQNLALFTDPLHGLQKMRHASVDFGDYDNDGDQDIVMAGLDASNGTTYHTIVYENNNGVFTNLNAVILKVSDPVVRWVDYDNDRDLDLFVSGLDRINNIPSTRLYINISGTLSNSGFAFKNLYDGDADWGDYDNDGDMDLLLTGDSIMGYSFTKLYRNDLATFTLMPVKLPGASRGTVAWGDYDNDGDSDILLSGENNGTSVTQVYENLGANVFTPILTGVPGYKWANAKWGDYDNDHDLDFVLTGSANNIYDSKIYSNQLTVSSANTVPLPPYSLTTTISGSTILFNWAKTTDNETPQDGLNYNMYCGTSSGGVDIMSPMADLTTGYHKEARPGNTGSVNGWKLKGLSPGRYWWGVQTIDQAFAGSSFSNESSFTIFDSLAPTLYYPYSDFQNAACNLQTKWHAYAGALNYHIIVSDTATFSNIIFQNNSVNDTVILLPNLLNSKKYYWKVRANFSTGNSNWSDTWTFKIQSYFSPVVMANLEGVQGGKSDFGDFDNDGDMDLLLHGIKSNYITSVYTNTNGTFSDINAGLIANNSAEVSWGDFDNDNDLDVACPSNAGIKIYRNNNGVFVNFQTLTALGALAWGDYDNDGDLDLAIIGNKIFRNDGNTFTAVTLPIGILNESSVAWGDYDGDNDLDLLVTGGTYGYTKILVNSNGYI
ncbi:MAG: VCBS repeat-containing protein [Burkholderiales bacterium]|nr:VCBS repeat-containing protein [Bacteroidia bacterium]